MILFKNFVLIKLKTTAKKTKKQLPECGRTSWPRAPCSWTQVLLGCSHAARLRHKLAAPSGRNEGVWDFSRLSIRKLFPELPKPGKAGRKPAIFLLVQLWTETILLTSWPERSSSVTLNSPLILSWVTRPTSLNSLSRQKFSALLLSGLLFATRLCCDWLRGSNVLLNSDKAGAFLEWQKVDLAHSLCQLAY